MVRLMIGRDLARVEARPTPARGAPVLEVTGLRTLAYPTARVDLTLHRGEILGLAGLVGAGRTELARAIFGIDAVKDGRVAVRGRPLPPGSVAAAIAAGLCLVPEDRKAQGLLLDFAIAANIALPNLAALSRSGVVDLGAEAALAEDSRRRLAIRTPDVARAAAELSGGNQQKVVLAKWLARRPDVLLFDEPTRGIDVGARAEVYRLMRDLADRGVGILMISSDMEEVIGVSDRVAVMCRGRITGTLDRDAISEEAILRLAVG
jgi:ribose transport system ATP-binding protein